MKRAIGFIWMFVFVLMLGLLAVRDNYETVGKNMPAPIDEDEENRIGRREYFDFLNTGGADFDWKTEYAKKRREKAESRLVRQKKLIRSGGIPRYEVIADGALRGTWKERGANNVAGRIRGSDVLEDLDLVVLGTDGGSVMVGPLSGNDYVILNDQIMFDILSVHAFDLGGGEYRVVVADAGGVYYTDDKGVTWNTALSSTSVLEAVSTRVGNKMYLLDLLGNLYRSTDMGETFSSIGSVAVPGFKNGLINVSIWTARYSESPLYIQSKEKVYAYEDGSVNLKGVVDSSDDFPYNVVITGDKNGGSVLYSTMSRNVYKSTDGGINWSMAKESLDGLFAGAPRSLNNVDFIAPNTLYFGSVTCYRSTNNGSSWTELNEWYEYNNDPKTKLHADICHINSYRNSTGTDFTLISSDGGTYITYDHSNYENITLTGMRNAQYYGTCTRWEDPEYMLAGSQDQGAQLSIPDSDSGILNFDKFVTGDDGSFTSSDSGKSAWYTYQGGSLYYHPNTRFTNYRSAGKVNGGGGYLFMAATMADPSNPQKVYIGGNALYYMTYNGSSFNSGTHSSSSFNGRVSAIASSPIDENHWYLATNANGLYYSSDRGKNWSLVSTSIGDAEYTVGQGIVPDPNILGRIYVCGNGNGGPSVFVSDDHGSTLKELANSPQTTTVKMAITPDSKYIFAATSTGPYVYSAEEDEWFDLAGENAPDNIYLSVEYIPTAKIARFGTYGRGIWDFNVDLEEDVITSNSSLSPRSEVISISIINQDLAINLIADNEVTLKLLTLDGRQILCEQRALLAGSNKINLAPYRLGQNMYLVSVESKSGSMIKKITIQ